MCVYLLLTQRISSQKAAGAAVLAVGEHQEALATEVKRELILGWKVRCSATSLVFHHCTVLRDFL